MRRLAGYDLNGWRDLAVRNWVQEPGEDDKIGQDIEISGGIAGSAIAIGDEPAEFYIGGTQARFAPHGKGSGWGEVGNTSKRSFVRDLLRDPDPSIDMLSAPIAALAQTPDVGVMSIEDTSDVSEILQERLLEAMRRAGVRRRLLVWRPVLAILPMIEDGHLKENSQIGVITHTETGLALQVLKIRLDKSLAPERRTHGKNYACDIGLSNLRKTAVDLAIPPNAQRRNIDHYRHAITPDRMVLGEETGTELLKKSNGTWELLHISETLDLPDFILPEGFASQLDGCDQIVFETPMAADLSRDLSSKLETLLGHQVMLLTPGSVAWGARIAAGRLLDSVPIYYDFLPQISTIIEGQNGPESFDLVHEGELLPAGQVYRSVEPAKFKLHPYQEEVEIYLNKELEEHPRLADLTLGLRNEHASQVELILEQIPVSGRARLTLQSEDFPTPYSVDWNTAAVIEDKWETIIEELQPKRPSIPGRLVLPSGMEVWDGFENHRGLMEMLKEETTQIAPDWHALSALTSSRPEGHYSVDSDGNLPGDLDHDYEELLDDMLERAEEEILSRISENHNPDNEPLKFATWVFRRCPETLMEPMIDALGASVVEHPLLLAEGSRALMYQGLGRALRDPSQIRTVMDHLLNLPLERWKKNQMACMAFLVSRIEDGPRFLSREEVDFLSNVVARNLRQEAGGNYTSSFIYSPGLLVGLLRWRMVEPFALVLGKDPEASKLDEALDTVLADLSHRRLTNPRLEKHFVLLKQAREAVKGTGTHTNLLTQIFGL